MQINNIQRPRKIILNIKTLLNKGKLRITRLLKDVFEREKPVQEEVLHIGDSFSAKSKNKEYVPPWITTKEDVDGVLGGRYSFFQEDEKIIASLKTPEEKKAYRKKLIIEGKYKDFK